MRIGSIGGTLSIKNELAIPCCVLRARNSFRRGTSMVDISLQATRHCPSLAAFRPLSPPCEVGGLEFSPPWSHPGPVSASVVNLVWLIPAM